MRKSRFTEEQITIALRRADAGTPVAAICLGVEEAPVTAPAVHEELGGRP